MQHRTLVACAAAALVAGTLACSDDSTTPVSPSSSQPGASAAGPDGSTLKATAPTPQSPTNNQQPDSLVLVATKSTPTFATATQVVYSYEFEIKNSGGSTVCNSGAVGGGSDANVSYTPTCTLEFDQPYTWRVRAVSSGAVGPWSATASFRAPAGGYIRGNEVFDPLTIGRTVGDISGAVEFIQGTGVRLVGHDSFITYRLPQNLQGGEYSMMVLNGDEGNPGDKSKILSMQEGPNVDDLTTDDYRMTAELRGRNYGAPGSVTYRIIPGDGDPRDGHRIPLNFNSSRWYFWRFSWQTGIARLEVREDGPNGRAIYDTQIGTGSHPYRPDPHYVHIGAPIGRAGFLDATMPGIIVKNVWVSSRPRPAFPGE
jgi:hypothetical protein